MILKKAPKISGGGGYQDVQAQSSIAISPKIAPLGGMIGASDEIAFHKPLSMNYVLRPEVEKALNLDNISDWYLFMLKEKFDNAIDFIWKYYPSAEPKQKYVKATIRLLEGAPSNNKVFYCSVTNSNPDNRPVFANLDSILDFSMTFGTKQNDHTITRGTLGDAVKRLASIPYTLMQEQELTEEDRQWPYPTIFRFNGKEYHAMLNVDQVNKTVEAKPVLITTPDEKVNNDNIIEVVNTWPVIDGEFDLSAVIDFCNRYFIFTTDISFSFELQVPAPAGGTNNSKPMEGLDILPATTTSPISDKWVNTPSIYSYGLTEFESRLYAVYDRHNTTLYAFVKKFREWNQVPKQNAKDLDVSIADFLQDRTTLRQRVKELYLRLRRGGKITKPPDKLSLPYTVKQERKQALAHRIGKVYQQQHEGKLLLDVDKAVYEIAHNTVIETDAASGGEKIQYPFAVEIIAVPYTEDVILAGDEGDCRSTFFVGAINYSVHPTDNAFAGDYEWFDSKTDNWMTAYNMQDIFEKYNFNFFRDKSDEQKTKIPCVIAANLISPVLSWEEEGKSSVNIKPFQETMAEAAMRVANRIKTFRAAGIQTQEVLSAKADKEARAQAAEDTRRERAAAREAVRREKQLQQQQKKPNRVSIKDVVSMLLLPRIEQVLEARAQSRPLPQFVEETQDSVWYDALPLFDKHRVRHSNKSRPGFKNEIRELCKKHNVYREEIGIIAAPWGSMYYKGIWSDISYHTVKQLAKYGTDIIFIEKRDIVQQFSKYANKLGIALINTHGHLSESAKELAKLAEEAERANVAILTDYDIPGIHIASKLPGVVRLGIDERTLSKFDIPHQNTGDRLLVAQYRPSKKLLDETINNLLKDKRFASEDVIDIDFLRHSKVEIDAVLSDQGPEPLWEYILELLEEACPTRDLTKVIESHVYEDNIPDTPKIGMGLEKYSRPILSKLQQYIDSRAEELANEKRDEIVAELKEYEGFVDIEEKEQDIEAEFDDLVDEDDIIPDIAQALDGFMDNFQQEADTIESERDAEVAHVTEKYQSRLLKVDSQIANEIKSRLEKLDREKGYGLMDKL
jgi:hypothetical protein